MAKAGSKMALILNLILVLSLVLMISIAESRQVGMGIGGKKPAAVCAAVYGAEEGDTCTSVSEMFNLSLDFFLSINPNINCDNFFVGQWLCTAGSAN
ncbi:hypothetical protein PRUPE_3G230600 [Prunus persica]|uniref:Uncharacterized protein n=1 Tax=Prunus persica TaxID=3760 RepID=M5WUP1_PRUPE|nr:lysM domain-containing protein ARB_03442 [Prunus persica]ONI18656.1 hypothetical protein PRUPE_3G230600 [Prunus persica]